MRTTRKACPHGSLDHEGPWKLIAGGSAICPDGKSRRLKRIATSADTFFSIPASVSVKGKTIRGYVTSMESEPDGEFRLIVFHPVDSCRNADLIFPRKPFVSSTDLGFTARYFKLSNEYRFRESMLVRM